jgi:hypothetical protein
MRMPTLRPFGEGCMSGEVVDMRIGGFANGAEYSSAGVANRSGSIERMRLIRMLAIMPLPILTGNVPERTCTQAL